MQLSLENKIALVTGGTRGLGREMVLAFAKAGADVIISSRKQDACDATAEEVRKLGRRALPIACHMGDWSAIEAMVAHAYDEWGRIDILVNNAGMSPVEPHSVDVTEALFDKVVGVNFKGP